MTLLLTEVRTTFWYTLYLRITRASIAPVSKLPHLNPDTPFALGVTRGQDSPTLAKIHDHFYPEVYRYVHYRLEDEKVCEDIASEVFLRLLKALRQEGAAIQNLRGWLLGTAAHLINDHWRATYARPVSLLEEKDMALDDPPERVAEHAWLSQQVRQALRQLTPDQQHVLALRFAEERSLEETAQLMQKSIGAVKTLQFRALAALRRQLDEVEPME